MTADARRRPRASRGTRRYPSSFLGEFRLLEPRGYPGAALSARNRSEHDAITELREEPKKKGRPEGRPHYFFSAARLRGGTSRSDQSGSFDHLLHIRSPGGITVH